MERTATRSSCRWPGTAWDTWRCSGTWPRRRSKPRQPAIDPDLPIDELADLADADADEAATARSGSFAAGPALDAADLELALRYLPDYRVVVIAQPLDAAALAAAVEAVRWSGAELIVVASGDGPPAAPLPDGATILEAPSEDAEGAFATVVGRYAAALDEGMTPAAAFEAASGATGWIAVAE